MDRNGVIDICYGNGRFVSVGGIGNVLWSTDGQRWWGGTRPLADTYEQLNSVCYGNNEFIAVGLRGMMLRSADGKVWTQIASPTTKDLKDITYADGKYMMVGAGAVVYSSPDGVSWSGPLFTDSGPPPDVSRLSCVRYGNGTWVAMGDGNTAAIRSTDGISWSKVMVNAGYKESMIHDGNKFIIVGNGSGQSSVTRSSDSLNWQSTPAPEDLLKIAHHNGIYIALGHSGTLYRSTDLTTWTAMTAATDLMGLTFADGLFCAAGVNQTATSPDGITWTIRGINQSEDLNAVCWFKDRFVTVGYGGYIGHFDWRTETLTKVASPGIDTLNSIATDGNCCVATTENGYFYHSADGNTWVKFPSVTPPTQPATLIRVRHVLGSFVVVGNHDAFGTSPDGLNWSVSVGAGVASDTWNSVASNGTAALMVGSQRRVRRSTNLSTWTSLSLAPVTFYDIAHGNGAFVAAGAFNGLYRSIDGNTWTPVFSTSDSLEGIHFANGKFLAWSAYGSGRLFSSTDGLIWKEEATGKQGSGYFAGFSYGDGVFFGAGDYGERLLSAHTPGSRSGLGLVLEPGQRFALRGDPSAVYGSLFRVEHSPDLSEWQVLRHDVTPTEDGTLFRGSIPEGSDRGFYRAIPVE